MKIRRKNAELIGYITFDGEQFNEWRCPDKNCGMGVLEDFNFCPYCGRKLKFETKKPSKEFIRFLKEI